MEEEVFAENYDDQEDERKYKTSSNFNDIGDGLSRASRSNVMVRKVDSNL